MYIYIHSITSMIVIENHSHHCSVSSAHYYTLGIISMGFDNTLLKTHYKRKQTYHFIYVPF